MSTKTLAIIVAALLAVWVGFHLATRKCGCGS